MAAGRSVTSGWLRAVALFQAVGFGVGGASMAQSQSDGPNVAPRDRPSVKIVFHRGASSEAPENTLPAIRTAVASGADYVEIDIRTTADGRLVLLHDATLDRTTDGSGPVAELSLASLAKLDAGAWFDPKFKGVRVPTLEEALRALGPLTHAYLDAKDASPEALLEAIRDHDLLDRSVVFQSLEYCRKLRALEPRARIMPPVGSIEDLPRVVALKPYSVDVRWEILSPSLVAECHAAGVRVFSDALGQQDTIEEHRRAIRLGIDGIQTDHPDHGRRAIALECAGAD